MKVRRVGNALLWSKLSSETLPPSIPLRCRPPARVINPPRKRHLQRSFVSSAASAIRSTLFTTSSSVPAKNPDREPLNETTSTLGWITSGRGSSRPGQSTSDAQDNSRASPPSGTPLELLMNKGSSAGDLISAFKAMSSLSSKPLDVNRMVEPTARDEAVELMKDISKNIRGAPPPERAPMRLTPTTGRTVHITPNLDLARGLQLLDQSIRRNKIRATSNSQRFHERPGLKRKRLKSIRWRKRFLLGFKATVNRVKQLKKQGW